MTEHEDGGMMRKQEMDYTAEVDEALPRAMAILTGGQLTAAIESLLPLEKKARVANDALSTARVLEHIVVMCFEAGNWEALGEYVVLLSKRRGQLKLPLTKMVQKACEYLDKTPDKPTLLRLIETLRAVTAGKIHVEIERARISLRLSKIHEDDGNINEAAEVLQELQVETYGSMDKREKAQFILEQMRLSVLRKDFVRVAILSKKISEKLFDAKEQHDLKLLFHKYLIEVARHENNYLGLCKHNRALFDTPCVKADPNVALPTLRDAILSVILAPYTNEQSDLVARMEKEPMLKQLPLVNSLLRSFITAEVMPWNRLYQDCGPALLQLPMFDANTDEGRLRFSDLKQRVVEHNIRILAKYYTRISLTRLGELLELTTEQAESDLSKLVVSATVYARIDRLTGIVTFRPRKEPTDVLQEWSAGVSSLMQKMDKLSHLITKERMVHCV